MIESVSSTIGNTPLLSLVNITSDCKATVLAKMESRNPMGSVKDRIALAMVEAGIESGQINGHTTVVEATSGNTGLGLALVCAQKKLPLILTMPESMSMERRTLLKHLGAKLILTPAAKGMNGAITAAEEELKQNRNSFMVRQFENPANPAIHKKTTAEEIWQACNGKIDMFVAGVGTGGTFSGVMANFKEKNPDIVGVAVEPADSNILSGGTAGPHKIQGIGAGFIPENLDTKLIDRVVGVSNDDAIATARLLAVQEGLLVGISSGAAMWACLKLAKEADLEGKTIVTILPDTGERYLSTDLMQE